MFVKDNRCLQFLLPCSEVQIGFMNLVAVSFLSFVHPLSLGPVFCACRGQLGFPRVIRNVFSQLSQGYLIKIQLISEVHTNPILKYVFSYYYFFSWCRVF